ncbi:MAG: ABC transporter permease [Gammaproteobacteria bacterium]
MNRRLANVFWLGVKELRSLRADPVMVVLIVYSFSFAIYSAATGSTVEVRNASVAIVDEDRSLLSRRIADALLPPYFQPPARLAVGEIDAALDAGRYTFVIDIPPNFQADVRGGRRPALQINVDATAMSQAGTGVAYLQSIISHETRSFLHGREGESELPVALVTRIQFNPNLNPVWFVSAMELINNITLLAIILAGAALIREREHGTVEHLLVMPLRPVEIMLAKVWANGLVILIAATVSLHAIVQGVLAVPIAGSIPLFLAGAAVYLFAVTALGIFLATLARTMPQFGLLAIPVFVVMNLLSGGSTPFDSIPEALQAAMRLSPSTHFVAFAQAILYRGAGLEVVWPDVLAMAGIGAVFFLVAMARFYKTMAAMP